MAAGQSYGIVGESGSGKSALLRATLGLLAPPWQVTGGGVLFRGTNLLTQPERQLERIRGKLIAFMPSNPRQHLNPILPVGRQIAAVILAHQEVSRAEATRRAVDLLGKVGIPDPASRYHAYPHELSGGMCQRIIIAMGLTNAPVLTLADEPTSGLDVTISLQVLDLMRASVTELGAALVLVSRDLGVIANYCERVAVMYAGEVVEEAGVPDFFDNPAHPYSRHLLRAARASRDTRVEPPATLTSAAAGGGSGCKFAPRCPIAIDACLRAPVPLGDVLEHHQARCLRAPEIVSGRVSP